MSNVILNLFNINSVPKSEQSEAKNSNAYLLNQPIVDTVEITGKNKIEKKGVLNNPTAHFSQLTKDKPYAGKMSDVKFFKYYMQKQIDMPTVEKLVEATDLDIDAMSRVYMTGKKLNDENFVDKIVAKANGYQSENAKNNPTGTKKCVVNFYYNENDLEKGIEKPIYSIIHDTGKNFEQRYKDDFDVKTDKKLCYTDVTKMKKDTLANHRLVNPNDYVVFCD